VRKGGESRSFVVPEAGPTAEQLETFAGMKLVVSEYYMHVGGLQFIDNPKGAELLRKSQFRTKP
jgi:hypothetical protein